jgi:parvulin-like peptidyl-prolyl isomerase
MVVAILLLAACGDDRHDDIAARVDGQAISRSDVESARAVSRVEGDELTPEQTLDMLIGDVLVLREAARLGVVADEAVIGERVTAAEAAVGGPEMLDKLLADSGVTRERFRERVRTIVLTEALQKAKFPEARVSAADAARYYRKHLSLFSEPESVKLGVIQARTAGPIRQSLKEIEQGDSFADAARRHSTDEVGRQNGGQQGWIQTASLPPGVKETVAKLKPGQVSDAFKGWPAWYLVKVYGRRAAKVVDFETARDDIVAELTRRRRAAALRDWLAAARSEADVVIAP